MTHGTKRRSFLRTLGLIATLAGDVAQANDSYARGRATLLQEIDTMARELGAETGHPVFSARVMAAMAKVQRHRFVPAPYGSLSYTNRPLPVRFVPLTRNR